MNQSYFTCSVDVRVQETVAHKLFLFIRKA